MPKFPVVSGKETINALMKNGFFSASRKGSHVKLRKFEAGVKLTAIVPIKRELRIGTLKSILRQANLTLDEFDELLKK